MSTFACVSLKTDEEIRILCAVYFKNNSQWVFSLNVFQVTIFQECQPEFLHDLVLKMRAYIFTPGDLICRQGEVAREMFIIADGLVEIIRYRDDLTIAIINYGGLSLADRHLE